MTTTRNPPDLVDELRRHKEWERKARKPRPLTPKQKVLRAHPDAFAYHFSHSFFWCIFPSSKRDCNGIGDGRTPAQAWARAAEGVR